MIILDSLTKRFGPKILFEDVSMTFDPGKRYALVGANGAGKSTLLKGLMGLQPLDGGEARFFGASLQEVRGRVVYVPQRTSVDWDFPVTVEDVVLMGRYGRLGLFGRPSKEDRRAATEALAQMGMEGFARRQISQLSGGQQQRVFLARALAQGGDLLFMDEPFVGVDAATETAILDLLRAIRAKGGTVVVVHHDLHMAREAFDELVLLNRRVIAHGASAEVFTPALLTKAYGGRLTVVDGGEQAKVLIAA